MNEYTIYCTEEQTRKALALGAPIEYAGIPNLHSPHKEIEFVGESGKMECAKFALPTAEQMISWLEEQKVFVHIEPCVDISCSWRIASKGYNKYGYTSDINVCKSRREATLASIDKALEYLTKRKYDKNNL